jgi:hypothetical protein
MRAIAAFTIALLLSIEQPCYVNGFSVVPSVRQRPRGSGAQQQQQQQQHSQVSISAAVHHVDDGKPTQPQKVRTIRSACKSPVKSYFIQFMHIFSYASSLLADY